MMSSARYKGLLLPVVQSGKLMRDRVEVPAMLALQATGWWARRIARERGVIATPLSVIWPLGAGWRAADPSEEAARRELNPREALANLCEAEIANKDQRRIRPGLSVAKSPFVRRLAGFDHEAQPALDQAQLCELASGRWIANGDALLLLRATVQDGKQANPGGQFFVSPGGQLLLSLDTHWAQAAAGRRRPVQVGNVGGARRGSAPRLPRVRAPGREVRADMFREVVAALSKGSRD